MSDWPELDALIRKREEIAKQAIAKEKAMAEARKQSQEEERQRQIAFQQKVLSYQPRFIEILTYWDKVIGGYLARIAKETWKGWQGPISKSLDGKEVTDSNIKDGVVAQLNGSESIIVWSAKFSNCSYSVQVDIKDFKPIRITVDGMIKHIAEDVSADGLKKVLLIAFDEGPYCYTEPPPNPWEGWSIN